MTHHASPSFWLAYEKLEPAVQELADKNFVLLKANLQHPSLRLKKVGRYWSARVGRNHRALAIDSDEGMIWFWIGNHADYEKILQK